MCDPVTAILGAASLFSGFQQANAQKKAAKTAAAQQAKDSEALLKQRQADEARRSKKKPNLGALLAANRSTLGGNATQLTGIGGVNKGSLNLGGNTLLGQ